MSAISPMKNKDKMLISFYELFNNAFDVDFLFENFLTLIHSNFKDLSRVQIFEELKDVNQFTVSYEITNSNKSMLSMRIETLYKKLKELNNNPFKILLKDEAFKTYDIYSLTVFNLDINNSSDSLLVLCSKEDLNLNQDETDFFLQITNEFAKCFSRLEQLEKSSGELKRLKLQNELLREQDRLKSDFINNISHELRTPLSGILGFSKILSSKKETTESKEDIARHIQDSANRLSGLICDLVQVTGNSSGWVLNPELIDVNKIVKDSVEDFSLLNKDFKIKYESISNCPKITSDPKLLRQVLDNLISNAIKYSVNKKEVLVNLEVNKDKSEIVFSVTDSGVGINKEELSKLFDRFYRSSNPEVKAVSGSGLGLSISKEIIETLGGEISVDSELGRGSRFVVTLPF